MEAARPGLAFIMRNTRNDQWRADGMRGFVISHKIKNRRKLRNYFVPIDKVVLAERHLSEHNNAWAPREVYENLERLPDSDM